MFPSHTSRLVFSVYKFPLSLVILVFVVMGLSAFSNAQQICQPNGDVDQNGSVTAADALLVFQQALSLTELNGCQLIIANVFHQSGIPDGSITASDALCIFQKALGLPSCLDMAPLKPQLFHENSVEQPCQFAHIAGACGDDGTPRRIAGLDLQDASDGQQAPVYYHNGYLYVGAEVAQPSGVDDLPTFGLVGKTIIRHGQITDGVGRSALVDFLQAITDGTVSRPASPSVVKLAAGTSDEHASYAIKAVQLVNSALPAEYRLQVSTDSVPARSSTVPDGEVYIDFAPRSEWIGATASQTAVGHTSYLSPTASHIWIQDDYQRKGEAKMLSLLVHELMHTFRLEHPVPSREDTLIKPNIDSPTAHLQQPKDLLWPLDREGLLAIHTGLDIGYSPNSLGAWETESWHISGEIPGVAFGVRLRNGHAEPWAQGRQGQRGHNLGDNANLSGSATWTGHLVGFTPSIESVVGEAALTVNLATMGGTLGFTALEYWGAEMPPGKPGTGMRWGDGGLQYTIDVQGYQFRQIGGDEGIVTGTFFGPGDTGMGGVLERDDLTAAFGGKR